MEISQSFEYRLQETSNSDGGMLAFGRFSLRLAAHHTDAIVSRPAFALRALSSTKRGFKFNESGFNKFGHDYTYASRTSATAPNNLDEINRLVADRLRARKTGQYDEADEIRDLLFKKHGVVLDDREKVWSTASDEQRRTGDHQQLDYQLAPGAGPSKSPLSEQEILNLIGKRLKCKMSRNFQDADVLLQKLHDANVSVHDKAQQWRADGIFFDFNNKKSYTMSRFSEKPASDKVIDEIVQLLANRLTARRHRHFDKADAIMDELKQRFNVEVRDDIQAWSIGGDFGLKPKGAGGTYLQAETSKPTDHAAAIQELVNERNDKRNARDFEGADQLRDRLMEEYEVVVNDRSCEWLVVTKLKGRSNPRFAEYKRRGSGPLPPGKQAEIKRMVQDRSLAKQEKNFDRADEIREILLHDFNVRLDDNSRTWMLATDDAYSKSKQSAHMDAKTESYIEDRVNERALAKVKRDYETADAILDELRTKYGVLVSDRSKEWWIDVPYV